MRNLNSFGSANSLADLLLCVVDVVHSGIVMKRDFYDVERLKTDFSARQVKAAVRTGTSDVKKGSVICASIFDFLVDDRLSFGDASALFRTEAYFWATFPEDPAEKCGGGKLMIRAKQHSLTFDRVQELLSNRLEKSRKIYRSPPGRFFEPRTQPHGNETWWLYDERGEVCTKGAFTFYSDATLDILNIRAEFRHGGKLQ